MHLSGKSGLITYQGDPETGAPITGSSHEHHIWLVDQVYEAVANHDHPVTFFFGGSRNFSHFIGLFDGVFILEIDGDTVKRRLDARSEDEFGGRSRERELIARLHRTKADTPKDGIVIDATAPLVQVVTEILRRSEAP